jgi:ClpP class serine protease
MAYNTIIAAILRGQWLIDKSFADSQMPLVMKMLTGDTVDFSNLFLPEKNPNLTRNFLSNNTSLYTVFPESDLNVIDTGSIAIVNLCGPMMKFGGPCSYGMVDYATLINNLGNNNNVTGIILSIDSPGGQADGTAMLSDVIKYAAKKKPVCAIIQDGMAASAAMWIASACTEIYCTQLTDRVGSIGVYQQIANYNKHLLEFKKLEIQDVYAPQSTDKNKNYKDAIAGDVTGIQQDLSILADQFINTISSNRAGKIKGDSWKTGKLFYATDAIKIGLIDGIKSFDQVVARMLKLNQINKNSSLNNKSNNMAFDKTLTAAGAESFEVVDGGFLLSEEQLTAIEATITSHPAVAQLENTVNDLATANGIIDSLNATITENNSLIAEASATNESLGAQIISLQSEVETLGAAASGNGTNLISNADENPEPKTVPSYLDDKNPINQYADKHIKKK